MRARDAARLARSGDRRDHHHDRPRRAASRLRAPLPQIGQPGGDSRRWRRGELAHPPPTCPADPCRQALLSAAGPLGKCSPNSQRRAAPTRQWATSAARTAGWPTLPLRPRDLCRGAGVVGRHDRASTATRRPGERRAPIRLRRRRTPHRHRPRHERGAEIRPGRSPAWLALVSILVFRPRRR